MFTEGNTKSTTRIAFCNKYTYVLFGQNMETRKMLLRDFEVEKAVEKAKAKGLKLLRFDEYIFEYLQEVGINSL